jgi:hypothetical protein
MIEAGCYEMVVGRAAAPTFGLWRAFSAPVLCCISQRYVHRATVASFLFRTRRLSR